MTDHDKPMSMVERATIAAKEAMTVGDAVPTNEFATHVATAVVLAMREPAAAMIKAGVEELKLMESHDPYDSTVRDIHFAMIDAALTESK